MKEHNYALQNADTCHRLQSRMQNICFVISISAVILKLMVKITSISSSYRFLRIAWHDIFSLSQHLLASWNLYILRVSKSKSKCFLMPGQVKGSFNPIPQVNHRTHLKDCTPVCLKFGKTSHLAVENLSRRTAQKWHRALL